MKRLLLGTVLIFFATIAAGQENAKIREYNKTFKTYPFSDPDPVPELGKVYPYYRFDGYTNVPVNKEWKVVELENDFIKVMVLPEIGGKIWAAIEKTSGKSFIYYNEVVKFRDVAMRGPWTSGGLEPNYGIVGHTPNCATPVDYTILKKEDGSVSCVVGVLDLLTRSVWRVDINLQKDKAYFTTNSTWYNASPYEQPYYHWMNGALRAADDLQFIFPGTKYIGHGGEYANWPVDDKGRDLSYYRNNNFGTYKSYHVFGKHSDFWGGYYHNEDFGMARYSGYDDKAGKKIWIWGLSREGMIWDKLLSDTNGQYVEVQSGRLFNQPAEGSSMTPFKNRGFSPHTTDKWTEYWFPVKGTQGLVAASNYGSLNLKRSNNSLSIYFQAVQPVDDDLKVLDNGRVVYSKKIRLKTMEVFKDSVALPSISKELIVTLGDNKLSYDASPASGELSRPYQSPSSFDWNSVQGLHIQGKEFIRQRMYTPAEEKLQAALKADSNYLPALSDYALLMYRQMKYAEALLSAKRALSIDAYDPAANYYYGLINERLNKITDAKDGYDVASQSVEFRSAAYTRLAFIYYRENSPEKTIHYARKSIESNHSALDAYQLIALVYRLRNQNELAAAILDTITRVDPLNHFSNFERYLWDSSRKNRERFTGMIKNEMPEQTFMELASWYYNAGRNTDALKVLELSKPNAEIVYWKSFLSQQPLTATQLEPGLVFPFRHETASIIEKLLGGNDHWLLKYHLALIRWNSNDKVAAKKLFDEAGDTPDHAPFYAARAKLYSVTDSSKVLSNLLKARALDNNQWRYARALITYYLDHGQMREALQLARSEYKRYPSNYVLGMLYAKALIGNKDYAGANGLLSTLEVLPNEGATGGRVIYRDTKLMLAAQNIKQGNHRKALQYISESREWPERLGSGKPYQEDIDERVEDWLAYKAYQKLNNKGEAQQALNRIVQHSKIEDISRKPTIHLFITALAMKNAGKEEDAKKYLNQLAERHPSDESLRWMQQRLNGDNSPAPKTLSSSDTYQLLAEANLLN